MRNFFYQLLSTNGVPSTRLLGAAALILTAVVLEFKFATPDNVIEIINSNLIAIGSYFGIGAARMIGEKAASTPAVDNSTTEITSRQTDVQANNVTMKDAAPE